MDHYFTNNQIQIENRKEISFRFLDFKIKLNTADSTFSKDHVDQGTQILLKTITKEALGNRVLDYGCGYGVIAVVLSKLGYTLDATDITDRALTLTKENAEKNEVKVTVFNCAEESIEQGYYDTVILNPPIRTGKENIFNMYSLAKQSLVPNGKFYIVIRKQHGAKSSVKKLEELFEYVEVMHKEKGYWIVKSF